MIHARCCYPSLAKVLISEYYLVLMPSANHPFCCARLQDRQNPRLSIASRASPQPTCQWLDPSIDLIISSFHIAGVLASIDKQAPSGTNRPCPLLASLPNQSPHSSRCLFVPNLGEKQGTGRQFIGREASKQQALDWIATIQSSPHRTPFECWGRVGLVLVTKTIGLG